MSWKMSNNYFLNFYYRLQAAWIGLSAPDPGTGYVWSDGTPVSCSFLCIIQKMQLNKQLFFIAFFFLKLNFQQWKIGEPNNKNNVESCVERKPERSFRRQSWSDIHCEKYSGWLCQIRAGEIANQTHFSL